MTNRILMVVFWCGAAMFVGCEGEPTTQYDAGMTTGAQFEQQSKPVGDPSRAPYSPEMTGPRIEIPTGGGETPPKEDAPLRNRLQ